MKVTISNTSFSATIDPLGAELIRLEKNNKNYIWTVDETYWNKTSPILFPIVGRLKKDSYVYQEQHYELPRHGFARNFEFNITAQTENFVSFSLENTPETLKIFPFLFELVVCYTLSESGLEIKYDVRNKSEKTMPFSIGAHPAFALDHAFSDYLLEFNVSEQMLSHVLEKEQFDGSVYEIEAPNGILQLDYSLFKKDALVFKHLQSNQVTLMHHENVVLKMTFEGFPYLGIWTKPNAPFLCIEPWCGLADHIHHTGSIEEKEGIVLLAGHEHFTRKISIEV